MTEAVAQRLFGSGAVQVKLTGFAAATAGTARPLNIPCDVQPHLSTLCHLVTPSVLSRYQTEESRFSPSSNLRSRPGLANIGNRQMDVQIGKIYPIYAPSERSEGRSSSLRLR